MSSHPQRDLLAQKPLICSGSANESTEKHKKKKLRSHLCKMVIIEMDLNLIRSEGLKRRIYRDEKMMTS